MSNIAFGRLALGTRVLVDKRIFVKTGATKAVSREVDNIVDPKPQKKITIESATVVHVLDSVITEKQSTKKGKEIKERYPSDPLGYPKKEFNSLG